MRRFARPVSAIALILTIVICFSGCGIVDFTKSILTKENTEVTANLENNTDVFNQDDQNNTPFENTDVLPSTGDTSESTTTAAPGTSASASTGNNNTSGSAGSGSSNTATQSKPSGSTTQTTNKNNSTGTTNKPVDEDDLTVEDIKEMPIKDVQDLLFSTNDASTANKILVACGFEYDAKQGIYYSHLNPLQRKFGFNFIYDMAAPMAGMFYDTKRIEFIYDNREWMIQIWKGQYGITSGAEIGLYNRPIDRVMQYDCADDEDLIEMQFDFYNQNQLVFSRGPEKHWWLTGFKIFNTGVPILIDLDMTLKFTNITMARAFYNSLKKVAATSLIDPMTYSIKGSTVSIYW